MVVFQPGGAQDRAQLLRQLDVSESSPGPAEAVLAIRKWYRLLQRAADLNIALPDESLQVRSLSNIVRRTAEAHSDFKFRVALAKTELQIDSRPSQQNVMKFLQHLLAELEQLGAGNKKHGSSTATPSSTTTTPTAATTPAPPSLKGMQPVADGSGGGKGKQKGGVPAQKRPCQWFGTDQGCKNGKQCTFVHSWTGLNRGERCLLCGSKQHRAKDCGTKDAASPERPSPPPPPRSGASTSTSSTTTPAIAPSLAKAAITNTPMPAPISSPTEAGASGGNGNKIDAAKMTEILTETNQMLKALTSKSGDQPAAAVDPLTLIQQQLDEVRRLRTLRVRTQTTEVCSFDSAVAWYEAKLNATSMSSSSAAPLEEDVEALLDSGASHPFRPPRSEEELQQARRVNVSLATGDGALLPQTSEGTLLSEGGSQAPIIPMGQLVTLLGCQIKWTQSRLTVIHPVHGQLRVRLRGNCPVLPVAQALTLISELEQARVREFQKTVDGLQAQVRALREQGREGWNWQRHLRAFCEEGSRTSLSGVLHRCPTFASVPAEVLLGIPEDVPCDLKDGWKLLKGMPWSRARRKAMFASTSWTVHLFSGDERARASRCTSTMRSSFWSVALEGNEVMVNVDVTYSRALDLNHRDGVFRLLCWAALSGRIKAIVGGPPRQSFPAPLRPDGSREQYQKEIQLITRMMVLWYVAEEGRCKAWRQGILRPSVVKPHVAFLLEHPDNGGRDDRASFFASPLWKAFAMDALMGEVECKMNGRSTVLGGNLDLWHLQGTTMGPTSPGDPVGSMWPLELVANVAHSLKAWVGSRRKESLLSSLVRRSWMDFMEEAHEGPATDEATPGLGGDAAPHLCRFDADEWRLHLQRDHLPYRKDCRVCVERSTGKPHRKVSHPTAYSLSIDTAGPFRTTGRAGHKYLLVACYRFPKLPGTKVDDETKKFPGEGESIPKMANGEDWLGDGQDPLEDSGEDKEEGGPKEDVPNVGEKLNEKDVEVEALRELAALEFSSIYIIRPMESRKHAETLRAVQEAYIQLRSCGLPVHRLHADRAREYNTKFFEQWAASRDIDVSKTQGDDPPQNGTAERAVRFIKMRMRILLAQARELSGLSEDVVGSLWPYAAETASAQQEAEVWGQPSPSVARFGSKVFTRRKGYGQGGRTDLLPKWVEGVYLGPARSVPGGHMVLTDEGNLWYTTNIRQFQDLPDQGGASDADAEPPAHPPLRRVRRKSSIVELAGGVGLIPGFDADPEMSEGEEVGLRAIARLPTTTGTTSSEEIVSDGLRAGQEDATSNSSPQSTSWAGEGSLAAAYLRERRFSVEDCLKVLERERFRRTKKQRAAVWQSNEPPSVHTTLGAYQRGPWTGVTTATTRHEDLTAYLTAVMKYHSGENMVFSSMTIAKDLCADAHKDRFNMRGSRNYVLTLGAIAGGGIWQEGSRDDAPVVMVEVGSGEQRAGYVLPVLNQVVEVDPKRLHMTMAWSGGPKWTIIAHTIGQHGKLDVEHRATLQRLGFVLPPRPELKELRVEDVRGDRGDASRLVNGPCWFPPGDDPEAEMWTRMWTRRVLDEEQLLASVAPDVSSDLQDGLQEANDGAMKDFESREMVVRPDRLDADRWLVLCRLAEGEEEVRGVETLLESLPSPLKVVYTVALDEVKQFVSRWREAIHKEAGALLQAKALVPLSADQQRVLEKSGKLVILPAKGVFTVKPPDQEMIVDKEGNALPPGDPQFYKRKARLVICGNFQSKRAQEDSYAGGCQADALRVMLVRGAALGWSLASTDIRNAFILAPIQEEDDEEEMVYALYPPKVFQLAEVPGSSQLWRVDRALYGFRRSPRLWGRFRDKRLRAAKIEFEGGYIRLKQHKADENIWSVQVTDVNGIESTRAYINVYVDDILYVGEPLVIIAVQQWLTSEWKASPLTWASEESTIRFLGLEIGRDGNKVLIHQRGFVEELLRHHGLSEVKGHQTPCPQEWLLGEAEVPVEEFTPEQLRKAQAVTGELLWLSGKSRPDLMHTVASMSSWCLRDPVLVERIGLRALGYLKHTLDYALVYDPRRTDHYVEGFSDASFAPHGSRSVGCCLTRYLEQPVSWRCGRQALVALSVAEAELIETVSATQMAYGIGAITEELHGVPAEFVIKVDNAAAVGLSNESGGTWKTRHLKVRAFHLREAVRLREIRIEHIPGLYQLGDLGTKAFNKPRLQELLRLWGLRSLSSDRDEDQEVKLGSPAKMNGTLAVLAKLVVILGWMIQGSRAETVIERGIEVSLPWELYGLLILGLVAAIGAWEAIKWFFEWLSLRRSGSVEESRGARRLRRLQQAVQEEVARNGFDDAAPDRGDQGTPTTPLPTSARTTAQPSSFRMRIQPAVRTTSTAVQTDEAPDGYMPFQGPFVMSEHGDRVHHEATCYGLRSATTRRRQVTLCQYCQRRQQLFSFVG